MNLTLLTHLITLLQIYKKMAADQEYHLDPIAEFKLMEVIDQMLMTKDESSFGNARTMRNLLNTTIQQLSIRVSNLPLDKRTKEIYQTITADDLITDNVDNNDNMS